MIDLEKMRDDYRTVVKWWRDVDSWTDEDLSLFEGLIKLVMSGQDKTKKEWWANFLAQRAEFIHRERSIMQRT